MLPTKPDNAEIVAATTALNSCFTTKATIIIFISRQVWYAEHRPLCCRHGHKGETLEEKYDQVIIILDWIVYFIRQTWVHADLIFVMNAVGVHFLAECKKNPEERENFTLQQCVIQH